jgi:CubicO group peptidase (beta-lactamase class C family)
MTNRRDFLLGAASSGLVTAVLVGADRAGAQSLQEPPTGLRAHLESEMRNALIPGMQVAVVRQGKVVFLDTFGFADIENAVPATNATRFQIASCTKAFTGVALMQLVESGKLDLAAPVSRYLEGLPATWRAVTIAQIATHTSGLPHIESNPANVRLLVDGDAEASWARVQTLPMEFTPGEKFSYNQTNYVLLGKLIDVVSGEPFIQFIQKHQLDVVGMPRTVFGDDHDVVLHSARTYTPYVLVDGKPERTNTLYKVHIEFPTMLRGCAGLNSTAQEIAHWLIALQRGELLKSRSSLTTLWTARAMNDGKPGPWGIGAWVFGRPKHPVFFAVGAAKSALAVYPDDDLAIVVLTNLSADMWLPFIDGIAAHYIPDLAKPA